MKQTQSLYCGLENFIGVEGGNKQNKKKIVLSSLKFYSTTSYCTINAICSTEKHKNISKNRQKSSPRINNNYENEFNFLILFGVLE